MYPDGLVGGSRSRIQNTTHFLCSRVFGFCFGQRQSSFEFFLALGLFLFLRYLFALDFVFNLGGLEPMCRHPDMPIVLVKNVS